MRVLLIANPIAGRGRGRTAFERVASLLGRKGIGVEAHLTHAAGDARRVAASSGTEFDRIAVVGGDGTLNEVVNGLAEPGAIPLALFPVGTANVLARELGLPGQPEPFVEMFLRGEIRHLDLGLNGSRRFLCMAGVGFDAMVTAEVRRRRSGSLGFAGYLIPLMHCLSAYRPPRLRVHVDGGPPVAGGLVVIGNARNYGGLFVLTDHARTDSGRLDVRVLQGASRRELLRAGFLALGSAVDRLPGARYLSGTRVEVEADEPVAVQIDGDSCGTTPVVAGIQPAALPFVVPRSRPVVK